jgi:hypothetical protein
MRYVSVEMHSAAAAPPLEREREEREAKLADCKVSAVMSSPVLEPNTHTQPERRCNFAILHRGNIRILERFKLNNSQAGVQSFSAVFLPANGAIKGFKAKNYC